MKPSDLEEWLDFRLHDHVQEAMVEVAMNLVEIEIGASSATAAGMKE